MPPSSADAAAIGRARPVAAFAGESTVDSEGSIAEEDPAIAR